MVKEMEEMLYQKGLTSVTHLTAEGAAVAGSPGLVKLERDLFHLASMDEICTGVFYMLPIPVRDVIVVRFMESGCYRGFYKIAEDMLKRKLGSSKSIAGWKLYTDRDLELERPAKQFG